MRGVYHAKILLMDTYLQSYKGLNTEQKRAVDAIEGPVMVIAGPGTGKTQVLALRIANILTKTDTPANAVLCLTFTNAGVQAMRERLLRLMGSRGSEVHIYTFHRFAMSLIEKNYTFLDFEQAPTLLSETDTIGLIDEILESGIWHYIRPRSDSVKYVGDLKVLISLLKRERMSPEMFALEIDTDIDAIRNDADNISSRGARKGELKMEALKHIESLQRTKEVVEFYTQYEAVKKQRFLMDYDDVLSYAVELVQISEDVRATLREEYLYILVDEHQDSSGIQNAFLQAVWQETDQPNIFVVGDDRQLIYGFGGASIEHFTNFRSTFGAAKEITLIDNYRSTQTILDAADALLQSSLAEGLLKSNTDFSDQKIDIYECAYPRDEIIVAARDIAQKIASGIPAQECAILVPKNYQVRSAVQILREQGVPVATASTLSFFNIRETKTVRSILAVIADPYNAVALTQLFFDPSIAIPPLEAHRFLKSITTKKLCLEDLITYSAGLLATDPIARLTQLLTEWLNCSTTSGLHALVQMIGEELFFNDPIEHSDLMRQVEVIRTFIHLLNAQYEKDPTITIATFVAYLDRLEQYHHEIPLAVFTADSGVRVLTLHGSKGLEFRYVHIAHLDESSLMKGKRSGFVLPARLVASQSTKQELDARRELYVAITRAKHYCSLSYARQNYTGGELVPARLLFDIPEQYVVTHTKVETEATLLAVDPKIYITNNATTVHTDREAFTSMIASEYVHTNVSVTLLNNFYECPWKWYFRNMLKLPERKSESLLLGSAVHSGIEHVLKHRDDINNDAMREVIRQSMTREFVSDTILINRIVREAESIIEQFIHHYLPTISHDALSERSVFFHDPAIPQLTCYGKIDLTEPEGDTTVSVTDFKTGGGKTKGVIEKRDDEGRMSGLMRQLAMYSYLIQSAEKGTEVIESKLFFLEEDIDASSATYITRITQTEIHDLKNDIKNYDELVQNGEWIHRPCNTKTYGAGETCEHCELAKKMGLK